MKRIVVFTLLFAAVHIVTYFLVGALAYELITNQFYEGDSPVFAFMRTEGEPDLWAHTMRWMLPGQVLRGVLMGLALAPFATRLLSLSVPLRGLSISALYFVFAHVSAAGPTTSNIEGFIYFRPEFFSTRIFLLTQPEIVLQALALGFLFAGATAIPRVRVHLQPPSPANAPATPDAASED
jgi:hypothetical protein